MISKKEFEIEAFDKKGKLIVKTNTILFIFPTKITLFNLSSLKRIDITSIDKDRNVGSISIDQNYTFGLFPLNGLEDLLMNLS